MKMKILLIVSLYLINFSYSEDIPDIPEAIYDGNKLTYSIIYNLKKYLDILSQNNSEVEKKEIYTSVNDLSNKKGGMVKGSIFEIISKESKSLDNYVLFNSYEEAQIALNNYSIDYFLCYREIVGELIQMNSENLTYINDSFEEFKDFDFGCAISKENQELIDGIKLVYATTRHFINFYQNNWLGLEDGYNSINKTMTNPKLHFSYMSNFNTRPYSYINENNEEVGLLTQLLYQYARYYDKNISVERTFTDEDLIPAVLNSTVDMSVGCVILSKIDSNKIEFVKSPIFATPNIIIRYDNGLESLGWELENSVEQFDEKYIGSLPDHKGLIKQIFKNTKDDQIYIAQQSGELFNYLLSEQIDAILTDELLVEFFEKRSNRISSYNEKLWNNSYGLAFKDEKIRDDFNEFLDENFNEESLKNLLEEWRNSDGSKRLDNSLSKGEKGKLILYFPSLRPMCYYENMEFKGFEIDLLYRFGRAKNYSLEIIHWLVDHNDDDINVNIGYQNITEREGIYFSKPIYNSSLILAVRPDSIRSKLPLNVLDANHQQKKENIYETQVDINGVIKKKVCSLPDTFYNESILINCTISNISENDLQNIKNMKNVNSTDRIKILYSTIRVDNLENAEILFPGQNIISQSNVDNIIYNNTNEDMKTYYKKLDKGLSTGAIVAIIIPLAVLLVAISAFALLFKINQPQMANNFATNNDSSVQNIKFQSNRLI